MRIAMVTNSQRDTMTIAALNTISNVHFTKRYAKTAIDDCKLLTFELMLEDRFCISIRSRHLRRSDHRIQLFLSGVLQLSLTRVLRS